MSAYRSLRFEITSAAPLLMHSGRLADPLDEHARAIAEVAGRRRKTEADHLRLAELEFLGSMYTSSGSPCIPGEMVEASLTRAAGQERRAAKARAGLVVRDDLRLRYDGPSDPAALWADGRFRLRVGVRVGGSRIMRTRPKFTDWSAELVVDYLPSILDPQEIRRFVAVAGEQIGLGDWRPKFGRFWAEPMPATAGQCP